MEINSTEISSKTNNNTGEEIVNFDRHPTASEASNNLNPDLSLKIDKCSVINASEKIKNLNGQSEFINNKTTPIPNECSVEKSAINLSDDNAKNPSKQIEFINTTGIRNECNVAKASDDKEKNLNKQSEFSSATGILNDCCINVLGGNPQLENLLKKEEKDFISNTLPQPDSVEDVSKFIPAKADNQNTKLKTENNCKIFQDDNKNSLLKAPTNTSDCKLKNQLNNHESGSKRVLPTAVENENFRFENNMQNFHFSALAPKQEFQPENERNDFPVFGKSENFCIKTSIADTTNNNKSPALCNQNIKLSSQSPILKNQSPCLSNQIPCLSNQNPSLRNESPAFSNKQNYIYTKNSSPNLTNQSPILTTPSPILCSQSPVLSQSSTNAIYNKNTALTQLHMKTPDFSKLTTSPILKPKKYPPCEINSKNFAELSKKYNYIEDLQLKNPEANSSRHPKNVSLVQPGFYLSPRDHEEQFLQLKNLDQHKTASNSSFHNFSHNSVEQFASVGSDSKIVTKGVYYRGSDLKVSNSYDSNYKEHEVKMKIDLKSYKEPSLSRSNENSLLDFRRSTSNEYNNYPGYKKTIIEDNKFAWKDLNSYNLQSSNYPAQPAPGVNLKTESYNPFVNVKSEAYGMRNSKTELAVKSELYSPRENLIGKPESYVPSQNYLQHPTYKCAAPISFSSHKIEKAVDLNKEYLQKPFDERPSTNLYEPQMFQKPMVPNSQSRTFSQHSPQTIIQEKHNQSDQSINSGSQICPTQKYANYDHNFKTFNNPPNGSQPLMYTENFTTQYRELEQKPHKFLPYESTGAKSSATQNPKRNLLENNMKPQKPNYRELLNHYFAMQQSRSEDDLNLQIINRTLNIAPPTLQKKSAENDLSKNIFETPAVSKKKQLLLSQRTPQSSEMPTYHLKDISAIPQYKCAEIFKNETRVQHPENALTRSFSSPQNDINITISKVSKYPDEKGYYLNAGNNLLQNKSLCFTDKNKTELPVQDLKKSNAFSPLDLSVKTIKTKADSTGCNDSIKMQQQQRFSGENNSISVPKINFLPNFANVSQQNQHPPLINNLDNRRYPPIIEYRQPSQHKNVRQSNQVNQQINYRQPTGGVKPGYVFKNNKSNPPIPPRYENYPNHQTKDQVAYMPATSHKDNTYVQGSNSNHYFYQPAEYSEYNDTHKSDLSQTNCQFVNVIKNNQNHITKEAQPQSNFNNITRQQKSHQHFAVYPVKNEGIIKETYSDKPIALTTYTGNNSHTQLNKQNDNSANPAPNIVNMSSDYINNSAYYNPPLVKNRKYPFMGNQAGPPPLLKKKDPMIEFETLSTEKSFQENHRIKPALNIPPDFRRQISVIQTGHKYSNSIENTLKLKTNEKQLSVEPSSENQKIWQPMTFDETRCKSSELNSKPILIKTKFEETRSCPINSVSTTNAEHISNASNISKDEPEKPMATETTVKGKALPHFLPQKNFQPVKSDIASLLAARIRTKGELKGFVPGPPVLNNNLNETKQTPPLKPNLPDVSQQDDENALNLNDWNFACNDFVEQLKSGTSQKKRVKKPQRKLFSETSVENKFSLQLSSNFPGREYKDDVDKNVLNQLLKTSGNFSNETSDEDKPLHLLLRQKSFSTPTPPQVLDENLNEAKKEIEKVGRREKLRINQEKRLAARLGKGSSSESDLDENSRTKKPRKITRKPRSKPSTEANTSANNYSSGSENELCRNKKSFPLDSRKRKLDEQKDDRGRKSFVLQRNLFKTEPKEYMTKAEMKYMSPLKLKEEADELKLSNSSNEVNDDGKKRICIKQKLQKKQFSENKDLDETMTRSKKRKQLEIQIANSKVLRNYKIIRNLPFRIQNSDSSNFSRTKTYLEKQKRINSINNNHRKDIDSKEYPKPKSPSEKFISKRLRSKSIQYSVSDRNKISPAKNSNNKLRSQSAVKLNTKPKVYLKLNDSTKKSVVKASTKFPPGWEHQVYEYKKSLKIPLNLISIKGSKYNDKKSSASLPDLDSHSSDFSEISASAGQLKTGSSIRNKCLQNNVKKQLFKENAEDIVEAKANNHQIDYKPSSIIDLLHSRVLQSTKIVKKVNKISNAGSSTPKVNSKSTKTSDLLPTPSKEGGTDNCKHHNVFETEVLTSRTRTESKTLKSKELIREIFGGEDRPASAPPDIENISFEEKYEQFLQKMNIDFGERIRKSKVQPIKQESQDHHPDRLLDNEKINSNYIDVNKPILQALFVKTKKNNKYRNCRRKGSSGFDYIRKKKKTSSVLNTNNTQDLIKKRKLSPFVEIHRPRSENEVSREIQKWVLNKSVGQSALHKAARLGYLDVIAYCLERIGMNPDPKDNAGYTPLHEACNKGRLDIARVLLEYGANHSEAAHSGIRPLHEAIENGYVEIVRLLLSYGADPLLTTYSGQTPLMLAEDTEMEQFIKNYLNDVQSTGPDKQPWKFFGPWKILDPDDYGFNILNGAPKFQENIRTRPPHSSTNKADRIKNLDCSRNQNTISTMPSSNLHEKLKLNCYVTLSKNIAIPLNNEIGNSFIESINDQKDDGENFEFEESDSPLPPLYILRDEGLEKWVLLNDLCNLLKVKSKDTLLKQIYPSAPPSTVNKELFKELKISEFLEKAICLQLICAGEKLNIRSSKVILVKYNERVRDLLGVKTISMKV